MAAIDVSDTEYTLLAEGGEGTAANPTQTILRFAEEETGTIYIVNDLEKQADVDAAAEGYPWPDTEIFACTLIAGQKIWGKAAAAPIEVRSLPVNP